MNEEETIMKKSSYMASGSDRTNKGNTTNTNSKNQILGGKTMKNLNKVLATVVAIAALLFAFSTVALAADLDGHWSAEAMKEAAKRGWITADANGNFEPNAQITRAEAAVIFWNVIGKPAPKNANPFTDVNANASYRNAVVALNEMGVINGMGGGLFKPENTLTREEFCSMAAKFFGLQAKDAGAYGSFADYGEISDWARPGMSAMVELGYIKGKGNNMAAPKDIMTRAEMVTVVVNAFIGERANTFTTFYSYAQLADIPNLYWVGTAGTDGKLNGYKLLIPANMTIELAPTRIGHTFIVHHARDGKSEAITIQAGNSRKIDLKIGDELSLEILVANLNGTSLWFRSELPQEVSANEFSKWYSDLGGVAKYAGGYSTITNWDEVRTTIKVAGIDAELVTVGGEKSIRFTASRNMSVTKTATKTEINIWLAPDVGDWTTLEVGRALSINRGDTLRFEIKEWYIAVLLGDIVIP